MILKTGRLNYLIGTGDNCSFEKARYDHSILETGLTENIFFTTLGYVRFKTPLEIIKTVLASHGYAVNLENILATLDHFHLTALSNQVDKRDGEPTFIKKYSDAIQFKLPSKSTRGELLSLFYKEIEIYESILSEKGELLKKTHEESLIKSLKDENKDLKVEIEKLYKKISKMNESSNATNQQSNQTLVLDNFKQAIVKDISISKRLIELKAGKKVSTFSLCNLPGVPLKGEECLVHLESGTIKNVLFYKSKLTPYQKVLGEVLFQEGEKIKLRDELRNVYVMKADSREELEVILKLRRGDRTLIDLFDGQIIKFSKCEKVIPSQLHLEIQEEMAYREILREKESRDKK